MLQHLTMSLAAATFAVFLPATQTPSKAAEKPDEKPDEKKVSTGQVGEKMPAFAAKFVKVGAKDPIAVDSTKTAKVTAYLFVGQSCPATKPYASRIDALEAAYDASVDFFYIYPNNDETADAKAKFHKECRFAGPWLDDQGAKIAKLLKVDHTGLVILCDKDGKVLYRGGIDDNLHDPSKVKQKYVADALDQILAGKPVKVTTGPVFGCTVKA